MPESGNDLLARLFDLAIGLRRGGCRFTSETGRPDPRVLAFRWEIGELAASGGDLRQRVFWVPRPRPASTRPDFSRFGPCPSDRTYSDAKSGAGPSR
ncbi:MAG: hypothetical protein ACRDT2_12490 [Natronosporangium sp.]